MDIIRKININLFSFYVLCTLNPWFVWGNNIKYLLFIGCFFSTFLIILENKGNLSVSYNFIGYILFYSIIIIYSYIIKSSQNFANVIVAISYIFFFIAYSFFTQKERFYFKKCIIDLFYVVIKISLFIYFIVVFLKVPLPHTILYGSYTYPFTNYYFMIIGNEKYRFQSVFLEPGHLGMILAFILYMQGYDFRNKKNILFLIANLFTFSLAAYVLLVIGIILHLLMHSKINIKKIILVLLISSVISGTGVYVFKKYSNSLLSVLILSRLQYDSKKGISGNNRNSYKFEKDYKKLTFDDKIMGVSKNKRELLVSDAGTSYKIYITIYGYFGLLLLFTIFLIITLNGNDKKHCIGCFLLYVASFLQRPYILWPIETYLFLLTTDKLIDSWDERNE